MGLRKFEEFKWSNEACERLVHMRAAGVRTIDIARMLGISYGAVEAKVRRMRLPERGSSLQASTLPPLPSSVSVVTRP